MFVEWRTMSKDGEQERGVVHCLVVFMVSIVFLNRPPFVIQNPLDLILPEKGNWLTLLLSQAMWGLHKEEGGPMSFG